MEVRGERVGHEMDAVERADVDAELARRAELAVHDRLRDVPRLDLHHEVAVLVLDAGDRAVNRAHGAVDAPLLVDHELLVLAARDRVRRALDLADPATDTRVVNEMRHSSPVETVALEGGLSKFRVPRSGGPSAWLSGIVLVAALARIAAGILDSPAHTFAETRLMPLVQTVRGLPAYPAPEAGPWYVPMYPPLSFLAYAPLLLASKPVAALRIASALSELYVLLPAALLLALGQNRARRVAFLGVASVLACWLHASPILTSLFFVHADAPAIFLAGLGVWLLA